MKFVKISILALTLGMFIASCGNGGGEATNKDTAAAPPATPTATTPTPTTADTSKMAADTTHKMMADTTKKKM